MIETELNRLKRMRMRSWHRGTKEMDLILGPFADTGLAALDGAELDLFDALLAENDHDLYAWISGLVPGPGAYQDLINKIRLHHGIG